MQYIRSNDLILVILPSIHGNYGIRPIRPQADDACSYYAHGIYIYFNLISHHIVQNRTLSITESWL